MARKISYSQSLMYPPNASLTMPDMGRFQKLESHLLPRPGTLRAKSCEAKFEWNSLSSSPFHPQTVSSSLSKPSSTSSHSPTSRSSLILNEPSIEELEYETSDDRDSLRPQNEAKSDPCRSVSEDDEGDQSTDVPAGFQTTSSHQSQSDSLLFEPWIGVQDLHILSVEITDLQARSIIHLAPSIGHTICRYRAQFQAWEQLGFTSPAILHARALVDQCLLRTLLILEPLWERCLLPLMNLKHDLQSLEDHLGSTTSNLMPEKEPLGSWAQLYKIMDSAIGLEGVLEDLSQHLRDLYTWAEARLTPAFAQLSASFNTSSASPSLVNKAHEAQVTYLLDAHSHLCQAMDRLAISIQLYHQSLVIVFQDLETCSQSLAHPDSRAELGRRWIQETALALQPIIESLSVLASVSSGLRTDWQASSDL